MTYHPKSGVTVEEISSDISSPPVSVGSFSPPPSYEQTIQSGQTMKGFWDFGPEYAQSDSDEADAIAIQSDESDVCPDLTDFWDDVAIRNHSSHPPSSATNYQSSATNYQSSATNYQSPPSPIKKPPTGKTLSIHHNYQPYKDQPQGSDTSTKTAPWWEKTKWGKNGMNDRLSKLNNILNNNNVPKRKTDAEIAEEITHWCWDTTSHPCFDCETILTMWDKKGYGVGVICYNVHFCESCYIKRHRAEGTPINFCKSIKHCERTSHLTKELVYEKRCQQVRQVLDEERERELKRLKTEEQERKRLKTEVRVTTTSDDDDGDDDWLENEPSLRPPPGLAPPPGLSHPSETMTNNFSRWNPFKNQHSNEQLFIEDSGTDFEEDDDDMIPQLTESKGRFQITKHLIDDYEDLL